MSENTALTTEIAGILSEAGEFESSRAPTVRAEDEPRQVTRVAAPRKDALAVGHVAENDRSPIANFIEQSKNLPALPPTFQNDWTIVNAECENRWRLAQEILSHALLLEKQGDFGQAAIYQNRAACIWAGAQPFRDTLGQMQALASAHGVARFQQALVQRHPWLMHKEGYEGCVAWCMQTYGVTREQAEYASPEDIVAGADAYAEAARAAGKRMAAPVPKAGKAKPSRSNPDGLSQGDRIALVSELLAGVK